MSGMLGMWMTALPKQNLLARRGGYVAVYCRGELSTQSYGDEADTTRTRTPEMARTALGRRIELKKARIFNCAKINI